MSVSSATVTTKTKSEEDPLKAPLLMDAPVLFPGRCATCGRSQGQMVDTHIEHEAASTLYLCADVCVPAFAALIGLGDTSAADERAQTAEARIVELETELAEAQPILDAMARAASRFAEAA